MQAAAALFTIILVPLLGGVMGELPDITTYDIAGPLTLALTLRHRRRV